jgi:hypothetical protein
MQNDSVFIQLLAQLNKFVLLSLKLTRSHTVPRTSWVKDGAS